MTKENGNNLEEKRSQVTCPVCFTTSGKYYASVNEFKVYKCPSCGLEYTNPIPSLDQLMFFYSTYEDIRAVSDVVRLNAKKNLQQLTAFGYDKNKYLLDFGAGEGDFVDIAGENCFGVDFKSGNKTRIFSSLSELPIKKYDFITLWGVLEHLADPIQNLLDLKSFINPNGIISITTVDAEGVIPYYYKPVEHLTYWTRCSIERLFEKIGLKLIEYKSYKMTQRSEIYIDRLLSRTPIEYRSAFQIAQSKLPKYIEVPTNEIFVVGKCVI
jgi:predicted RNA-binding Zn-ribbon protein involved in translation (DUF1610 family)